MINLPEIESQLEKNRGRIVYSEQTNKPKYLVININTFVMTATLKEVETNKYLIRYKGYILGFFRLTEDGMYKMGFNFNKYQYACEYVDDNNFELIPLGKAIPKKLQKIS